jgi:hypothetical protein
MRRICIVLCLSLFASLIHAAGMPINLSVRQSQHQMTAVDNSAHHCDEVANNAQEINTNQLCQGDSYQCCLGFVTVPVLKIDLSTSSSEKLNPQYFSMALQPMISFIYKPPTA